MTTLPTAGRLSGIRQKIERADHHVRELKLQVQAFEDNNRNCVASEDDPATGERVYRIRFCTAIPPVIPLTAGDAVHNLRSALDHLAWQLVEAGGGRPDTKTSYPISRTLKEFNKAVDGGKVSGVAPAVLDIIRVTQPYEHGYEGLASLAEIDNFDKHRLLIVAAVRLGDYGAGVDISDIIEAARRSPNGTASMSLRIGPLTPPAGGYRLLQDGDEYGRAPIGASRHLQPSFTFQVAFREPAIVEGRPVVSYLTQLTQLVDHVVEQFIPFL